MINIEWKRKITINKKNYWVMGGISGGNDLYLGKIVLSVKKGIYLNVRVFDTLLGTEKEIKTWLSKMKPRYSEQIIGEVI